MNDNAKPRKIAQGLHRYSVEELQEGLAFQRKHYDWDFSNEREFIENLFCQRFNFLLVIYSLFITAGASTHKQTTLTIILFLGTVLTLLVSMTIWRAYVKLIINLRILHGMPKHPFEFIREEVKAIGVKGMFGVNSIIGVWVPLFCTVSLALGTALAWCGIIEVG
ncbi:MAG: hypothetical protein IMZ65_00765 [Planctomycetes bacterium]|nr:hypothetical protein [Planctomycetota bacterium]